MQSKAVSIKWFSEEQKTSHSRYILKTFISSQWRQQAEMKALFSIRKVI